MAYGLDGTTMRRYLTIGLGIFFAASATAASAAPSDEDCFERAREIARTFKDRKFTWEDVKNSAVSIFGQPEHIRRDQDHLTLIYSVIVKEAGKLRVASEIDVAFESRKIESSAFGGLYNSVSDPILSASCKTTLYPPGMRRAP